MNNTNDKTSIIDKLNEISKIETFTSTEHTVISALVDAIVAMNDSLEREPTEGLKYKSLCRLSVFYTTLQKILGYGNQLIHLRNISRKNQLKQLTRTANKTKIDKVISKTKELSKEEVAQLIEKLLADQEES